MNLEKKRVCANCLYQYQEQHQKLGYDHFEPCRCKKKNKEACGDVWNTTCLDFVWKQKKLKNGLLVKGITLLTVEEAGKITKEILEIGDCWWLRSPGADSSSAANIHSDGSVYYFGNYVFNIYAVRPALILDLESSNLRIGNMFRFGGKEFKIISDTHALCTKSIGHCAFRENWLADDANIYEMSDIKKFVDGWYIQAMEKEKEKE